MPVVFGPRFLLSAALASERFSFTTYSISDGLAGDTINKIYPDSRGNVWIANSSHIYLISKSGEIKKIHELGGNSIFEDRTGKIWVDSGGNDFGIRVYSFPGESSNPVLTALYTKKDGLTNNGFSNAMAQTADGRIFIRSVVGLGEFLPETKDQEPKFRMYPQSDMNTGKELRSF